MVDAFTRAAWEKRGNPTQHTPKQALQIMLDDIEKGNVNPKHLIIAYADDDTGTGYYQAGSYEYHGAMGIMTRTLQLMGEK